MYPEHRPDPVSSEPVGYLTSEVWHGVGVGLVLAVPVWALIVSLALWIR